MDNWKIAQWAVVLNFFGIALLSIVPIAGTITIKNEPYYQWYADNYTSSKLLVCEGENCPVKIVKLEDPIEFPTISENITEEVVTIAVNASVIPYEIVPVSAPIIVDDTPVGQKVGNLAPNFSTKDIYGENVTLYELRGKIVVLNIWASWCGYCVAEFPLFQKVQKEDVKVIVVCIDEDNTRVSHIKDVYSKRYGALDFTFIADGHDIQQSMTTMSAVPVTLFIDTRGVIKNIKVGAFENYAEIDKYVGSCK